MAKIEQFNANNTEFVTQDVRPQGEFNILQGNSGLLPDQLHTAQGSNGIDTPAGATATSLSEPVNPHGVLLRNPNIASLYPATTESTLLGASTVNGGVIGQNLSFADIEIAFDTFSGNFAQVLPTLGVAVSDIVINNVYSGNTTSTAAFAKSDVNASGAGWIQSGTNIVWSNGNYPAFSGASATAAGNLIPFSGQTYFLDISYNDVIEGQVVPGAVGSLSISDSLKQVRVGLDNFGTSLDGTSEVTITEVTRDTYSLPNNQNLTADNVIPSVGSRFFR